ncbi:hypothetical protein T310_9298 [Rasamsonia emersonii CBS 393.64]|uniref:Uncharacterized protein n=1 Tax=Rasamsonia emersonii (strain ATCC 16479 / CBS 393.64 / IMI 116815) TaxID=1408163 RepID=A0A0F4YGR4_RASE3|nr:hypothetical protein T310_9298 [Rasamsonia emersonii CBS 393.64]KKA17121.1 hypothetical protein T310_9298 [Rasamsonia emersonii CBS 393.64]
MEMVEENPQAPVYPGSSRRWLFSKGEVNDNGEVLRACDERFLIELLLEMEQAYQNAFQFVFKNVSEEDAEDELYSYVPPPTSEELELVLEDILLAIDDAASIFNEVAKEVRRLQRYQDLYPTRVAMKRFHTALRMKLQDNHRKTLDAANKMQNEACWKKIHQAEHVIELWLKHPTFQPHLKPWQQFMMEDAPGSGMNPRAKFLGKVPESDDFELSTASEDSDFHIFPPGGMALWADWCKEYEELEEKCRQTAIPGHFNSEQIAGFFMFEPNLWLPERPSGLNLIKTDNLPYLSSLIASLENEDHVPVHYNYTAGVIVSSDECEPGTQPRTLHHAVDP